MKNLPIYENLDTSFVNLTALVRYLRRRRFVGNVRVELNGYEADITLDGEREGLKVREHDRIAGRIAEGEEAFERLLIRAREPGGSIHVYQFVEETETVEQRILDASENQHGKPLVEKEILTQVPITNGGEKKHEIKFDKPQNKEREVLPQQQQPPPSSAPPKNNSVLPFEFSNRVEDKAKQTQISGQDWQTLMQLTAELLGAIDQTLADAAGLDFASAFARACSEISGDYPFLSPTSGAFAYTSGGRVTMRQQVSAKLFTASINEALRRILEKLGANPKFAEVYRQTVQKILALIHQRKTLYDKFLITPQLEKILGV